MAAALYACMLGWTSGDSPCAVQLRLRLGYEDFLQGLWMVSSGRFINSADCIEVLVLKWANNMR
jgi:hypothetical protein